MSGNHWRGWRGDAREWVVCVALDALWWVRMRCDDIGAVRMAAIAWRAYLWTLAGERRS